MTCDALHITLNKLGQRPPVADSNSLTTVSLTRGDAKSPSRSEAATSRFRVSHGQLVPETHFLEQPKTMFPAKVGGGLR